MRFTDNILYYAQRWLENVHTLLLYVTSDFRLSYEITIVLLIFLGFSLLIPKRRIQNIPKNIIEIKTKEKFNLQDKWISAEDISAIAGDNLISTQLDLAKAYIEMDKKMLAKHILNKILKEGTLAQQQEAQQLMGMI